MKTLLPRAGLAFAVIALVVWSLAPAVWQVLTALKIDRDVVRVPTVYLPHPVTWKHVSALWERKPMGVYLANSTLIAGASTLLSILLAAPAASALGRAAESRRRNLLHALLALTVFPPILLLYPLYQGVRVLGWLNHPLALILPYAALSLPLSIWILERGFSQIPREVEEAAALDGLGPARRVLLIQLPLAAPSLVTSAILVFIFSWNEFMLALTFMTRDARKTITAGIASVSGSSIFEIPWGQLSAAIVIATLPLVVLVLLFEKRIASGLTRGAIKG
jgi:trehalose/maltose transport system permease protein